MSSSVLIYVPERFVDHTEGGGESGSGRQGSGVGMMRSHVEFG